MSEYRYILEKGNKKQVCPQCGKKRFVRFIDTCTGEYLPGDYGRCDREVNCGYFHKPDTAAIHSPSDIKRIYTATKPAFRRLPVKQAAYIPFNILKQSRKGYEDNTFVQYLLRLFGSAITENLIKSYQIGSSNSRWPGACIFWFIDVSANVRAGQVKLFDDNGHTARYSTSEGEKRSCTTWLHSILKYNHELRGELFPEWLTTYLNQGGNYADCLYGEHLLQKDSIKPVAIVEAPATAIVASVYLPAFTWLAAGSLSYLTADRCKVLSGRQVYLFPDLSKNSTAYSLWSRKAKELAGITTFTVSNLLEKNATAIDRLNGLDLRDYLTRFDHKLFGINQKETNTLPPSDNGPVYMLSVNGEQLAIVRFISQSLLGPRFNDYIIGTFMLSNAKVCDLLFDESGSTIPMNDDFLETIRGRIGKDFIPAKLDGNNCLVHVNKC
ncbi:DUF6371 domain-containing protein [Chitinophaga arvensicola]|uniref:Uncharacterized protein n=1 Tax=Chitinophaga arvensicola TaxID=29529 RepID=A0A1I0QIV4_9BACT|nr:DUF6371 domain-containing protein [Chitinophaga arvensicola]SEW27140.1 hypothetical protein SAMN04488122_1509 [Chitinophaga arvensicola]